MISKEFYLYILSNISATVLYTGITENLIKRIYQHKHKLVDGFTKRYNISKLVYYEPYPTAMDAIRREKQIKGGSRKKKIDLIKGMNPSFKDLYIDICG